MGAIEFDGVVRRYTRDVYVGPLTFDVPQGQAFGLIGSNGAGKTTAMRLATGLEAPAEGRVRALGHPVSPGTMPAGVAAMIEEPRFFAWLSGHENLTVFTAVSSPGPTAIRAALATVGLGEAGDKPFRNYSQGMRQRLGIARVLLSDAAVMIFDEPTNGLDPVGIRWFRDFVASLLAEGRTVVLSSHLLHEVQQVCSGYVVLAAGQVLTYGRVTDLGDFRSLEDVYYEHLVEPSVHSS